MKTGKGLFILFILISIAGCAPYQEVSDIIYLQSAKVQTPIIQMPAFVNSNDQNSTFFIRPRFYVGHSEEAEGKSGGQYPAPGSTRFNGNNYHITSSTLNIGVDADLLLSNSFGLSGGYNFSNINQLNLNAGYAGLLFKNFEDNTGIRFDAGVAWQRSDYDVQSVIERTQTDWSGNSETIILFCRDRGQQTNWSYYLNLNFTYDNPSGLIGGFLNLGYIQQQFLDIEPYNYDYDFYEGDNYTFPYYGSYVQTDLRNEISTGFFSLNGGIFTNITEWVKLMGGAKLYLEMSDNKVINPVPIPFIQIQLGI